MEFITTKSLWGGFDPSAEPLDVVVLNKKEKGGVITTRLYYTGRSFESGAKTRFYAVVCSPSKGSQKGVLFIDHYKKRIDEEFLTFLAKHGFTAMGIDFAGRQEKGLHTIYPDEAEHCNADVAKSLFFIENSVRENKLYDYSIGAMRAVTYLCEELQLQDVSLVAATKGSYIGAIVLGTDKRITRGAVIFGSLYRKYNSGLEKVGDSLNDRTTFEDKSQAWTMGLAPQSYLMQIFAPVYVITSANSANVDVVDVSKMYYRINDESRLLILPDTLDYLSERYLDGIINWLNGVVPTDEFDLSSFVDEEGNYCVKVKGSIDLDSTSVWYCVSPSSRARHWAKAQGTKTDDGLVAKLSVYSKNCDVSAFAITEGEVAVSSSLFDIKVENAKKVRLATNVIYSGDSDQTLISVSDVENWWGSDEYCKTAKGYLGIVGMKGKRFATFAVRDPSVRQRDSFTITFDVCSKVKQKLLVVAVSDYGGDNIAYGQQVQLVGDGKWQRVIVETKDFHRLDDGKIMVEEEKVDCLCICTDSPAIVNNILVV